MLCRGSEAGPTTTTSWRVPMFAYDYPLLGIFWTTLVIFLWIAWIFLLIRIFADIFRNHEMGGVAKAFWTIFVIFLPFLGVLVYLIAHGGDMARRDVQQAAANEAAMQDYIRNVATTSGSGGTADELAKLADLRSQGVINDAEFEAQKAKILAS
jgi:ABC-type multidrug transport system fused ATPase/permease subunit